MTSARSQNASRSIRVALALTVGLLVGACTHPSLIPASQGGAATSTSVSKATTAPRLNMAPTLTVEQRVQLSPTHLAPVGAGPWSSNPYRGQAGVIDAGRSVFHAACASCHGVEAQPTPEAPDLRRLNGFCRRVQDPVLKDRCQSDVDRYFVTTLHEGKVRAGVVYMPSWKGVLSPEAIWAVRTYLESLKPPGPARLPDRKGESPS